MIRSPWILLLFLAGQCLAEDRCSPDALSQSAAQVLTLQKQLGRIVVDEMVDEVPLGVAGKIIQLKDALNRTADATFLCVKPSVDPKELQNNIARVLHANEPEYDGNPNIPKDDPRFERLPGYYGHNLNVNVNRPSGMAETLEIQFTFDIDCGSDSMLLVYGLHDGVWKKKLRWQSPPLKSISDGFGDFFVSAYLHDSSTSDSRDTKWRLVVAHGTSWCTSRFSDFKIDLLSPSPDPDSPRVLWHAERDYSRGDFDARIKSSGNTFELRLNADCMTFDSAKCFERRVIYRYRVDSNDLVRRVGPMGLNARGFVEEWLTAPWSESRDFSAPESADALQKVHDRFDPPTKPNDDYYVSQSLGPVRACTPPGVFQVQINSLLNKIVPGKPGGETAPLASHFFHVREVKDGYVMLAAPTEPDPTCSGANLMAEKAD